MSQIKQTMTFTQTKELLHNSGYLYVITVNLEGRYSYVNTLYDSVFSKLHGSILNKPYEITMHPEDTNICKEVAAKCFTYPDQVFPATIRKHDGKGGYIITQWEYKAMFDDTNNPAGIFCIGYDITQFVLQQNDLSLAMLTIEKRDLALRDIAFVQSHLVRMPLTNILALTDIISKSDISNDVRNVVEMLNESARQLDNRIKSIVDTVNS